MEQENVSPSPETIPVPVEAKLDSAQEETGKSGSPKQGKNKKHKKDKDSALIFWIKKFWESLICVLPIIVVVCILAGTLPLMTGEGVMEWPEIVCFLICALLIALGLTFFNNGAEQYMSKVGTIIGETLFKQKKLVLVILMTFIIGVLVTIAEPDLKVMADQIGWNEQLLIVSVGVGVGLFVVFGVLRILFKKNLNVMFICFYGIVFALAGIVNPKFLPICFDSGGVTTGPVTVPFILAFGAGLAASKKSDDGAGDSFGLTALASVGPILTVMVLSLFEQPDTLIYHEVVVPIDFSSWEKFWPTFQSNLLGHFVEELKNVAIAIAPVFFFFIIYNFIFVRISLKQILRILVGLVYAYIGLVIFLGAVNTGFLPVANQIGKYVGAHENLYPIAIITGALFGLFGVLAEPAVHVLVHQIETVSEGTIKSKTVLCALALAIAGGVALAIVRAHFSFSILYYMVPGYIIALALSFLVPKIYTSMAFDSGGVASGPMASTFVMPFCIGFTISQHGTDYVYQDAFGCVAMIALMPLIVIQLVGLWAGLKRAFIYRRARQRFIEPNDIQVIHFEEEL